LTLGEANANDEVIVIGGVEFIFDKDLKEKVTPVKIDYSMKPWERGFVVTQVR
jgi:Fe-S cluster assembly iron-binding protein IscA